MKYLFFLLKILISEAGKNFFVIKALFFSFLYIAFTIILINYKSFFTFLFNNYPIFAKLKILFLIFIGSFSSISVSDLILLFVVSFLFGINLELVLRKIKFLKNTGSLKLTFGAGIVTLISAGCASCGLSLASLAGLTGAIAILPFNGLELYLLSIVILITSLLYNLQTLVKVCKLKPYR